MPLPAGTRLGPYEINAALGAGGMGEVYRARDTRLGRDVAVKLLAEASVNEPDARQRFDREARLASRLSHPHICPVYDVGTHEGSAFIVMECLDGESLARRLRRGPLPIADALRIAIEIADGLHHAHRNDIVHRDLKPANVMLTKSGAKILDFGIARPTATPHAADASTSTATTQAGAILGTPGYMAPEQVRGLQVDQRTDVFAFGALLFEMIAGRQLFGGKTAAEAIAAVLSHPVAPLSTVQPSAPPPLDHVVANCLKQEPDERWQSIFDVATELRWIAQLPSAGGDAAPNVATRRIIPLMVGGALLAAVATFAAWNAFRPAPTPASPAVVRAALSLPREPQLSAARPNVAISPDGRLVALVGVEGGATKIFVRPIDGFELASVKGSDGASGPFFSPDGEWIGFQAEGRLMKVSRSGGPQS